MSVGRSLRTRDKGAHRAVGFARAIVEGGKSLSRVPVRLFLPF